VTELKRFLAYIRPYLAQMIAAAIMMALAGALMSLVVATLNPLVNEVLLARQPATEDSGEAGEPSELLGEILDRLPVDQAKTWIQQRPMAKVPVLLISIFLIRGVLLFFGDYLTRKTGSAVIRDIRADLHDSLIYQAPSFYRRHQTGEVMSRLLNDVHLIKLMSTQVLADFFRVSAMAPAMLILVLLYDWKLTLFALIVLPVMGYPVVRLGRRLRKAATRSQQQTAIAANQLKEAVSGVKIIQAFSMEELSVDRFRETLARLFKVDLQAARAAAASGPIVELVGAIAGGLLFYYAGRGISSGTIDPGNFVVVLGGLTFLFMSARRLNQINVEVQQAMSAASRVFAMMDWPREVTQRPDARVLSDHPREIHFDDVVYTYPDSDEPALKGIQLKIQRGEMVALVGPSGGGKTTMANLMLRFADPTSGRVAMDGYDLRDLTLESVRGQIGLVTQETTLFDDTVSCNIAAGRRDADPELIRRAAVAAQAHEFVSALPDGYDTMLGEDGARLSMGQRQRLTIARAFFKDPPFLVLDEATSALDAESEDQVQRAMNILLEGRGSLVIAHRLATIREADRIVVLEGGRIIEQGSHRALLESNGLYAHLHELQFRE
jgi:subfamily B ATP-binding cassette protein MsbA